jgi:hypothetical protein
MSLVRASSGGDGIILVPAGEPVREGNRVVYAHGIVDEVYDVEAGSIEQSFVVHGMPRQGSLELTVATESDFTSRESADLIQGGTIEVGNERGGLRIGRATVVDAAGHRVGATTRVVAGGIEIDVPAEYLAGATFPVVVDPVITPFTVDYDLDDDYRPDVAFDATTGSFMTVYEEAYSATDHDVRYVTTNMSGATLFQGYVDGSTDNWGNPRVANNNVANQFLAVAQVGAAGSRVIKGRTFAAVDMAFSPVSTVSGPNTTDATVPEVGGDPSPYAPSYYCVVYEDAYSLLDHDIRANMVTVGGAIHGATILVDTSAATLDQFPSISPSNGVAVDFNDQRWTIVWQRQYGPGDSDIYGAQIGWDGAIITPSFGIDTSLENDFLPSASTQLDLAGTSRYAVAWQRRYTNDSDIVVFVMDGANRVTSTNLSLLENVTPAKDQILATIDSDGREFVVAYSELYDSVGSDYDVIQTILYCSGNSIGLQHAHQVVTNSLESEMRPEIVTCHGSGSTSSNYMIVYDRQAPTEHDIWGAVSTMPVSVPPVEFCFGTIATCPCGNNGLSSNGCANSVNAAGAHLATTGDALVQGDTLVLSASGMPATATSLFFQGSSSNSGAAFGDGIRCVAGSTVRLGTKTAVNGNASFPGVGNPHVSVRGSLPVTGGTRYYQCWYRNASVFCTPSTFNLTNAVEVHWLP